MDIISNIFSQVEILSAQIQTKIAKLFECKLKLLNAQNKATDPGLQSKISGLLRVQENLEKELPSVLGILEKAKISITSVTLTEAAQAATFYYEMCNQIKDTNGVSVPASVSGLGFIIPSWVYWVGGYFLLKKLL